MLSIGTPPLEHKGEEDEEHGTYYHIRNAKTPAMLVANQIGNNIAVRIKLIHQLLRNEAVNIFRGDNTIADKKANKSIYNQC